MTNQLTVALDMDSTVYDLHEPWLDWLHNKHGERLTPNDILTWDFHDQLQCHTAVYKFLELEGAFLNLKPYPGAVEAIRTVHDLGVRQFFISTVKTRLGPWEKQQAVKRDFPYLEKSVLITTGDKDIIRADLLVDDGPHNLIEFEKHGLTCKFPFKYNEHVPADFVMTHWDQYPGIIKQLLEARERTLGI